MKAADMTGRNGDNMKLRNKILVLLMSAVMVISYLPIMAFADDEQPQYPVPVSVEFHGPSPVVMPGTYSDNAAEILTGANWITVNYSDGSYKDCGYYKNLTVTVPELLDENNNPYEYDWSGFLIMGDDVDYDNPDSVEAAVRQAVAVDENRIYAFIAEDENAEKYQESGYSEGYNPVGLQVIVPYLNHFEEGEDYTDYELLGTTFNVWASEDSLVDMQFVAGPGFHLEGEIGSNYIFESDFYGEGNRFEVDIDTLVPGNEGEAAEHRIYHHTYEYATVDGEEGFFERYDEENYQPTRFEFMDYGEYIWLDEGENDVTIPCNVEINGYQTVPYDLKVSMIANQFGVYCNWPNFYYDGTYVTKAEFEKKFTMMDSQDNVIPADKYTYTWKNKKNIGWYTVEIKFNDPKYPETYTAGFDILLKAPKLTKAKAGKKKLTVTWAKMSKAQLSKTDCMFIEVARDKDFSKGYKQIKVSAKYLKKNRSKTISGLTGGKKYYVRAYLSTVELKNEYGYYKSCSNDSNTKTVTVKK